MGTRVWPLVVLAFAAFLVGAVPGVFAATFTVNSTGDGADFDGGVGTCETGPGNGTCTLRAAIESANTQAGGDTVSFDIPPTDGGYTTFSGEAWWQITPNSSLPIITDSDTTIDGTTQTANRGDTNSQGPEIEIIGSNAGLNTDGFVMSGGNGTIRGMNINFFTDDAIVLGAGGGNLVEDCYIGLSQFASWVRANGGHGIDILSGSTNNTIGGVGAGNVIGGSDNSGINISGDGNVIQGNYIGVDPPGTLDLGNTDHGIIVSGGSGNIIGGQNAGEGNVIAFNGLDGVFVSGGTAVQNLITGNSTYSNNGLGIDLDGAGANDDKAVPVIISAIPSGSDFDVTVTTGSGDTVQFFRVNNAGAPTVSADGTGSGEGYLYLGTCTDDGLACSGPHISGTDPAVADSSVTATLTASGLSSGDIITATATDTSDNTSEFSLNVTVPLDSCPTVSSTADTGPGTLRNCIAYANSNPGTTIVFDIPDTAPGYTTSGGSSWWRISPASALPDITASGTVIDGTTQAANYGSDTNSLGPEIEIEGSGAGAVSGLTLVAGSGSSTVRGLVINFFQGHGVMVETGSDGNTITGNYIGLDPLGAADAANGISGVRIESADNIVGGTDAADRNVLSGNTQNGVRIATAAGTGNSVVGNYIGTDATGTLAVGNTWAGVRISGPGNAVGGSTAAERNVISGNSSSGVHIDSADATGNRVQGNYIGADRDGNPGPSNPVGVRLTNGATGNFVGGLSPGEGNLITGNVRGVLILPGAGVPIDNSIQGNSIFGNSLLGIDLGPVIGVTPNDGATGALPNIDMDYPVLTVATVAGTTLHVEGYVGTAALRIADTHTIELFKADDDGNNDGEIEAGDGLSVPHGEGRWYIDRCLTAADGTFDCDLTIPGTVTLAAADSVTATATDPAGNTSEFGANAGVVASPFTCPTVTSTADTGPGTLRNCIAYANSNPGTTIVFDIPDTAPGYTISGGNSWWRISPGSALPALTADGTVIEGTTQATNYGLDTNPLGPEIEIDGSAAGAGADGLTVNVSDGNVDIIHVAVTNFDRSGIRMQVGRTTLVGSYIGLRPDGDTAAGNNTSAAAFNGGILVESAANIIGGTSAADRNVISGNTLAGIVISGVAATGNQVLGNYIGTDAGGTLDRGNITDGEGIEIQLGGSNTIGGTAPGAGNVISGNVSDGIEIDGSDNNVVQGNYIGTDYTGTVVIPNDRDGIDINSDLADGATGNLIGGTAAGAGNLIRGNTLNGIELRDDTVAGATTDNSILGNLIYDNGDLGIDLEPLGVTLNDAGDGDTGVNGLQNYPVITSAVSGGVSTTVTGTLNSTPGTTFQLEFFSTTAPDPLGYGEGDSFMGTASVTTDGAGDVSFTVNLPAPLATGAYVTATATGPQGTSEFSQNYITPPSSCPTVTATADTGPNTLRDCIGYANSNPGTTIVFDIPDTEPGYTTSGGSSWWKISPSSALPAITASGTIIDGTTQAANYGSDTNSLGPEIEIEGSGAGPGVSGLVFSGDADNSEVRGLMVNRFTVDGINIQNGANGLTVADNWIGTDNSGQVNRGNGDDGIEVLGANTTIDSNVIVNSGDEGINLTGAGATGTVITGNIIGLEPDGDSGAGNGDVGIALLPGATGTTIGGTTAAERNIISMNFEGIEINTSGNTIAGNYIGTDITGTLNRGNRSDDGVEIQAGSNNSIGGTAAGAGNLIAYNFRDGVSVQGGTGNRILGNLIYQNVGLGIDLNDDGLTLNDAGDGDAGPNNLQNFPEIITRSSDAVSTNVIGTLESQPSTTYWLEFYTVFNVDPLGHGEAEAFLGTATVTTNSGGSANFNVTLPAPTPPLAYITVTATGPAGNTSEFSLSYIDPPSTCPTVSNTDTQGVSTLRECINKANSSPGTTIVFSIPDTDPGYVTSGGDSWWRIAVKNGLPAIKADGTVIDGSTQRFNYGIDTNSLGPEIEITSDGASKKEGFVVESAGSTIKDLIIGGFDLADGTGIMITGPTATGNTITGNYIGTDYTGTAANANVKGVLIQDGASSNTVGGTGAGEANVIAYNTENGISIIDAGTDANLLSGNSIFENGLLGIDLNDDGVTPNDGGDGDAGPNQELNFPVISSIIRSDTSFAVAGSVGAGNTVQFFRVGNPASPAVSPDPTGYGEGYLYLATAGAYVEGGGSDGDPAAGSFRFTVPGTDLSAGNSISSTAIDAANNTSEFGSSFRLPLFLVKQAVLAVDGSLITDAATLPRGTVFKFLIYTENPDAARSDVSIRDVLDPAFAYSAGSLKVDNSASVGASVQAIYAAVNGTAPLTDVIDADVASIAGSTIDVGNRFVGNGQLDIAGNRVWALLFTVRMQ